MNAPIFKVKNTAVHTVKQYFSWKSGVRNTYTLTACSVERINGVYEFLAQSSDQYGNTREYFRNQSNSELYIAIYRSNYGDNNIYVCEYAGDITAVNAWDCSLISYYAGQGLFNEVYYSEPQIAMDVLPTVTTSNNGTGLFNFKLNDSEWSADVAATEYTVENLEDNSSHTFYVRETLSVGTPAGDAVSMIADATSGQKVIKVTPGSSAVIAGDYVKISDANNTEYGTVDTVVDMMDPDETDITLLADLAHSYTVADGGVVQREQTNLTESASCVFTVVFNSGIIQPRERFAAVETDLTSHTVKFYMSSYDSKLLSGLTRDVPGVSGMYIVAGIRNGASYYRNGDFYLWYSSRFSRWLLTTASQFDNESGMYEYYECYLHANDQTAPGVWASGAWYAGMMADMSVSGTPGWSSGIYHVIPVGSGICRYQINSGDYATLDAGVTSFSFVTALGNSYAIKISEQLDNGLWTPETDLTVNCHRLTAPEVTTGDGVFNSNGGRNVTFKWTPFIPMASFDGTALAQPVLWDASLAVDITGPGSIPGKKFHVTNLRSANGCFVAVKLLANTTYYIMVQEETGNMLNALYRPDGSVYYGIHDHEYDWEAMTTGDNPGVWVYQTTDQGGWGDFSLAVAPAPETLALVDMALEIGQIRGTGIFRFRINSGPWSNNTADTRALQMFQLPTGEHTIAVQEKSWSEVWSETGSINFTVTNGAEAGSGGGGSGSGITVPECAYLVMVDSATGKEYLWDGIAVINNLNPLTQGG